MTAARVRRRPGPGIGDPLRASLRVAASLAIVIGTGLTANAASAATNASATSARGLAGGPGDPDTTVTFTVTTGGLTMTAPPSADLGSAAPGGTISGTLAGTSGTNTVVTDLRATLGGTWTATASSTDWALVGGGGTTPE